MKGEQRAVERTGAAKSGKESSATYSQEPIVLLNKSIFCMIPCRYLSVCFHLTVLLIQFCDKYFIDLICFYMLLGVECQSNDS